jgi:O-antigen ligase
VAAAVLLAISTGIAIDSQSAVGQRLQSLNPSSLSSNAEDRYRLDERKNVLAEIRSHPVVGIGIAVPWQIRYPLSTSDTGQTYVHMAILFYWLKLGLAGVIAYLGYLLTGFVVGVQVFRRHPDPRIRVAGAGAAAGLVGLGVAETTATFLGSELRTTVLVGFVAGLLSVAYAEIRAADRVPSASTDRPVGRSGERGGSRPPVAAIIQTGSTPPVWSQGPRELGLGPPPSVTDGTDRRGGVEPPSRAGLPHRE